MTGSNGTTHRTRWPVSSLFTLADHLLNRKRWVQLYMDLSTTCDLRCVHCFREAFTPAPDRLNRDRLHTLECEVFPYVSRLALSETAESLYVRLLPEALAAAKRAGVPFVHIQTNGTHLTPQVSRTLLSSTLSALGISLDAATKETYEEIRRGAEWDRVIENIRTLIGLRKKLNGSGHGLRVALNFTLMRQNCSEALDFLDLAKSLEVDSVSFTHLMIERSEMKEWSLIYDTDTANRLCRKIRQKAERIGLPVDAPEDLPSSIHRFDGPLLTSPSYYGHCSAAAENWIFMRSNGNCYPCFNLQDQSPLGNVYKTKFLRIWHSYENRHFRRKALRNGIAEGCDHCKFFTKGRDTGSELAYLAKRLTTAGASEKKGP